MSRLLTLLFVVPCTVLLLGIAGTPSVQARVILKEKSLYQTLVVTEEKGLRCLKFNVRREQRNQSCMDVKEPKRLVFAYARMMLATLLFNPEPKRVLIVGLGGGTLPIAFNQLFPDVVVDVVELDPAVVEVAEEHFGYVPSERLRTHTLDARVYTKRLALKIKKLTDQGDMDGVQALQYDIILLDAFNGEYIPEHLMNQEYFQETERLLRPGGLVATNTFNFSKLYDHESVTFESVFGPFLNYRLPETANRIMLGRKQASLNLTQASSNAIHLQPKLRNYDVNLRNALSNLSANRDWELDARILTDQYNPVNLLRRQRRERLR